MKKLAVLAISAAFLLAAPAVFAQADAGHAHGGHTGTTPSGGHTGHGTTPAPSGGSGGTAPAPGGAH